MRAIRAAALLLPAACLAVAWAQGGPGADVTAVRAEGAPRAYRFSVTVKSPDTGCRQYAAWWEVVSEDGRLIYRRVLLHSHAGEQPFTRDGGPVPIQPDTMVWVRAYMRPGGYGGKVLKGSVRDGFRAATPQRISPPAWRKYPRCPSAAHSE